MRTTAGHPSQDSDMNEVMLSSSTPVKTGEIPYWWNTPGNRSRRVAPMWDDGPGGRVVRSQ